MRERIVNSGIADRMFASVKRSRGLWDSKITFGIADCDFRVGVNEHPHTGQKSIKLFIEMPNPNPKRRRELPRVERAFGVIEGESFGAADEEPLTSDQFRVVQELAGQSSR